MSAAELDRFNVSQMNEDEVVELVTKLSEHRLALKESRLKNIPKDVINELKQLLGNYTTEANKKKQFSVDLTVKFDVRLNLYGEEVDIAFETEQDLYTEFEEKCAKIPECKELLKTANKALSAYTKKVKTVAKKYGVDAQMLHNKVDTKNTTRLYLSF